MTSVSIRVRIGMGAALLLGGCTGQIGGHPGTIQPSGTGGGSNPSGGPPGSIDIDTPTVDSVGPAWQRRLTKTEVGNSIQALTGVMPAAVADLPAESVDYDFDRVTQ